MGKNAARLCDLLQVQIHFVKPVLGELGVADRLGDVVVNLAPVREQRFFVLHKKLCDPGAIHVFGQSAANRFGKGFVYF